MFKFKRGPSAYELETRKRVDEQMKLVLEAAIIINGLARADALTQRRLVQQDDSFVALVNQVNQRLSQ